MATTSRHGARSALRPAAGSQTVRGLQWLMSPRTVIVGGVILIIAYLGVVPLYFLLHDTFVGGGGFTLDAFGRAYSESSQAGQMLVTSIVYASGSAAISLVVGAALAYIQVRTNAPFKALTFAASLVPLIIPGILYAVAWIFLADPRTGLLNAAISQPLFGRALFNVYGLWGMIWVQGLHLAPLAFLLMVAAFRAMDPALEESALMGGAPRRVLLRKITLPLLRPALVGGVLLMFVLSLESFEVPALLGLQNGTYVFTSRIYFVLRSYPADYGAAGAYAISLLVIAAAGVIISGWLSRNSSHFQTVTGRAFRPRLTELGRARPVVGALVALYFAVTVALPLVVLLYASLLPYYRPSLDALKTISLANYRTVIDMPLWLTALKNTILLGLGSATVVMFLTAIAAWVVVRTRVPGRRLLDMLTFLPLVVPGLVLALALSLVYLRTSLPIYGTLWILLISYTTKYLPFGMRYASSAMSQISSELEESAHVCGASWWTAFRRVVVPLASSGVLAGWLYILIVSFRELATTVLLYSPGSEVLSVLMWEQFFDGQFTVVAAIGVLMVAILVGLVSIAYRVGARVGLGVDR